MFYFLRQNLFVESNIIEIVGHTDVTSTFNWVDGVRFDRPLPNETLLLDPSYGTDFPDIFDTSIPVISTRMLEALRSLGVSNVDAYPITLRNQVDGSERRDYVAINVIGCVDAIDLAKSTYRLEFGEPYFTGSVVIDPARAGGLTFFRVSPGPSFVVINEALATRVAALNLSAVLLQPTTDYRGT